MTTRHTLRTICPFGDDGIAVDITFNFTPGRPETPPAYSHGGFPAEDHEIEFHGATAVNGSLANWPEAQKLLDEWAEAWLAETEGYDAVMGYLAQQRDAA